MKHQTLRIFLGALTIAAVIAMPASLMAQEKMVYSKFLPGKNYHVVKETLLEGFDGAKDIDPINTTQVFKISTGKAKNGVFSAKLTAYSPAKDLKSATSDEQSVISFDVTKEGKLQNFKQIKGEGNVTSDVAHLIASGYLEGILLTTKYKLKRNIKRSYKVKKFNKKGTSTHIEFTFKDKSRTPSDNPDMVTKTWGKAVYENGLSMFMSSETIQSNEILVPEDGLGPAKEVRMKTTVRHKTKVK